MKILLTGANGYIGRRLLPVLVAQGHEVVCLLRDRRRIDLEESLQDKVAFYEADLLEKESLSELPPDIDAAYYLVHSMGSSHKNFSRMEATAARNFVESLAGTRVRQLIYLSGISNDESLSVHLQSRLEVERILQNSPVPVSVLRAAIIIGSGSASFEIIRDLVEKLPLMIAPRWLRTRCQPIAIHNVIEYLSGVLFHEPAYGKTMDIGGPDILTYKEMLLQFAEVRGFRRYILDVPFLSPKLSSYWLYFVTSTSFSLARSLVESMRNEVVVKKGNIRELLPLELVSYKEAVAKAFDKIAQNEVLSSWKDALASSSRDARLFEFMNVPTYGCFVDKRKKAFSRSETEVLDNIWRIGGSQGWYYGNHLWGLRGFLDKLSGGVGLRRGRRSPSELEAGDALDFWRVLVADRANGRLLLFAEMKLPGEAWLEFRIERDAGGKKALIQTATFRPAGVWGRLYWYAVSPFHHFLFEGMVNRIVHYQPPQARRVKTSARLPTGQTS